MLDERRPMTVGQNGGARFQKLSWARDKSAACAQHPALLAPTWMNPFVANARALEILGVPWCAVV